MTIDPFKVFLDLHLQLPRQGPGSRASTKAALDLLPPLPTKPDILDMGCGTGAQTMDLLELTDGAVTAIDMFNPMLDILSVRADAKDISPERLTLKCADMAECDLQGRAFDLI
jgi:ubiquinone/menaquinone biosynthesis C-methylase UbiE